MTNSNAKSASIFHSLSFILMAGLVELSTSVTVFASDKIDEGLFLSPKTCLLAAEESRCKLELSAQWTASALGDYCLYRADSEEPVRCWTQQRSGQVILPVNNDDSIHFELRKKMETTPTFTETFKLLKQSSHYRQKRRNPWSFY